MNTDEPVILHRTHRSLMEHAERRIRELHDRIRELETELFETYRVMLARAEKAEAELAVAQDTIDGLAEALCPCCAKPYDEHLPKGGGRESGDPDRGTLRHRQESSVAAAYPAARKEG